MHGEVIKDAIVNSHTGAYSISKLAGKVNKNKADRNLERLFNTASEKEIKKENEESSIDYVKEKLIDEEKKEQIEGAGRDDSSFRSIDLDATSDQFIKKLETELMDKK